VALGYWPDGQAGTVAGRSQLDAVSPGAVADRAVVELLANSLIEVVRRVRTRMDRLDAVDLDCQEVPIEVVHALARQLWMVRAERAS
jgi:hypothetical protein